MCVIGIAVEIVEDRKARVVQIGASVIARVMSIRKEKPLMGCTVYGVKQKESGENRGW